MNIITITRFSYENGLSDIQINKTVFIVELSRKLLKMSFELEGINIPKTISF